MLPGRDFRPADGFPISRTGQQNARKLHELGPGFRFQIPPEIVSANRQRDIIGMLKIGFADDAGLAVRTAQVVRDAELLQAQARGRLPFAR